MKSKFILYALMMVLICNYLFVDGTYAWFTATSDTVDGNLKAGDVSYAKSGEYINISSDIVPGETLLMADPIVVTNHSSVPTKLKVEIKCDVKYSDSEVYVPVPYKELLEVGFTEIGDSKNKLVYDEIDKCFYYINKENEIPKATDEIVGDQIPLITQIKLLGVLSEEKYWNCKLKLTILYFARQSKYAEWTNFQTDVIPSAQ